MPTPCLSGAPRATAKGTRTGFYDRQLRGRLRPKAADVGPVCKARPRDQRDNHVAELAARPALHP